MRSYEVVSRVVVELLFRYGIAKWVELVGAGEAASSIVDIDLGDSTRIDGCFLQYCLAMHVGKRVVVKVLPGVAFGIGLFFG